MDRPSRRPITAGAPPGGGARKEGLMRRTLAVAMAAVLALGLAFAAPAAAAPTSNPFVYHYAVTCRGSSFEVIALDLTGWEVNSHGTPSLLMGGEYTLQEESGAGWVTVFSFDK